MRHSSPSTCDSAPTARTALISDAVAEALLVQLETLGTGNMRDRAPAFLLSGLLRTPSGNRWYGNRTAKSEFYRVKTPAGSRNMPVAKLDSIVVETVANDLASSAWAAEALKATQTMFAASHAEEIAAAKAQIAALEGARAAWWTWRLVSSHRRRYCAGSTGSSGSGLPSNSGSWPGSSKTKPRDRSPTSRRQ